MSRTKALLVALLGLALLACGGQGSGEPPAPLAPIGYGPADTWHLAGAPGPDEVAKAGLGFFVIEHFPTVQDKDWRRGELLVSFPEQAKEVGKRACENGQQLVVFGLNWNVTPFRSQPDEWFREVLNEILSVYDPACTWLEPLVEPDEGDLVKAQRWTQWAADVWPGKIIMPAAGAHWPIRRDFVDRHPGSVADAKRLLSSGEQGLLVVTDGGPFVHPPSVFGEYSVLTSLSLQANVPIIFYTDRWQGQHGVVLQEISSVVE